MMSSGCAHQAVSPLPVAVKIDNRPSADLLTCAKEAKGLPSDQTAIIPTSMRSGFTDLALSYRSNHDQLNRLVNWFNQGQCR